MDNPHCDERHSNQGSDSSILDPWSSAPRSGHRGLPASDDRSASVVSAFSTAQVFVDRAQIRRGLPDDSHRGADLLSDLYSDFLNCKYDFDRIKAAVRKSRREREVFFIPTEPVGQLFIQCTMRRITLEW